MFKKFGSFLVFPIIALALWKFREPLAAELAESNPLWLIAAALVALVYLPLNASVWGGILQIMGEKVKRKDAAQLWIRCEAIRWLPGGIWGYASRVVAAKEIGVSSLTSAVSLSLELIFTIAAWGTLAVAGLAISGYLPLLVEATGPYLIYVLLAAVIGGVGLILLRKRIEKLFQSRFSGLSELLRNPLPFVRPWFEYLALNSFAALGLWFCFLGIHAHPVPGVIQTIGATASAWIVGFFAIFAPGGLGVREGVFALIYQPMGLVAEAAAAAVIWRAIQTVVELFWLTAISLCPGKGGAVQEFQPQSR